LAHFSHKKVAVSDALVGFSTFLQTLLVEKMTHPVPDCVPQLPIIIDGAIIDV
jgi:hypothetical protein